MQVLDVQPLGSGTGPLAGRCRLQMPSGLVFECRIYRAKTGQGYAVAIAGAKNAAGKFEPIVSFATPELSKSWAQRALDAITPHLGELAARPSQEGAGFQDDF